MAKKQKDENPDEVATLAAKYQDLAPLERVLHLLDASEAKPLALQLSADEMAALHDLLLYRYPRDRESIRSLIDKVFEFKNFKQKFRADRKGTLGQRAARVVREMGWTDNSEDKNARNQMLLFHYSELIYQAGAVFLINSIGNPHPIKRVEGRAIKNCPLGKQEAIDELADWYCVKPGTMRQWLKSAKSDVRKESEGGKRRLLTLKLLDWSTLPWTPD